jgi:hypothetical protein
MVMLFTIPDFPLPGLLGGFSAVMLTKGGVPLGFHFWAVHRAAQERRKQELARARMRAYYRAAGLPWLEDEEGTDNER